MFFRHVDIAKFFVMSGFLALSSVKCEGRTTSTEAILTEHPDCYQYSNDKHSCWYFPPYLGDPNIRRLWSNAHKADPAIAKAELRKLRKN